MTLRLPHILITAVALLAMAPAPAARAETVGRRQAQDVAELFFNAARGELMAPPTLAFTGREFTTSRLFIPFYVFNHPTGGFIVVSADNKAYPVLAYSLRGRLEPGRLSAGQRALFGIYGRHIEYIRYDSRVPAEAVAAWGDLRAYVAGVLGAQTDVTDLLEPWEEVEEEVRAFPRRADAERLQSGAYTPARWDDMVAAALARDRNVVMGIATLDGTLIPAVATGRSGAYFRLRFSDAPSDAMYLLQPTEFISQGEVALINGVAPLPEAHTGEEPFTFYTEFVSWRRGQEAARAAAIEETLHPSAPVVTWNGDGHFSVLLPEEVESADVFNVAGMTVARLTYRDTPSIDIDLSALPAGFYIAVARGASGRQYSLRLYR